MLGQWKRVYADEGHMRKLQGRYVVPKDTARTTEEKVLEGKDLEAQLDDARAEICRLRSLMFNSGDRLASHEGHKSVPVGRLLYPVRIYTSLEPSTS